MFRGRCSWATMKRGRLCCCIYLMWYTCTFTVVSKYTPAYVHLAAWDKTMYCKKLYSHPPAPVYSLFQSKLPSHPQSAYLATSFAFLTAHSAVKHSLPHTLFLPNISGWTVGSKFNCKSGCLSFLYKQNASKRRDMVEMVFRYAVQQGEHWHWAHEIQVHLSRAFSR